MKITKKNDLKDFVTKINTTSWMDVQTDIFLWIIFQDLRKLISRRQ